MSSVTPFRKSVDVTANKTLAAIDAGIVQNVITDGITITLPSTAAGLTFIIRNGGDNPTGTPAGAVADGSALVTVAPASVDQFLGNGYTATDNKAAINTKATSMVGDQIVVVGDGSLGYYFQSVQGIWARQA